MFIPVLFIIQNGNNPKAHQLMWYTIQWNYSAIKRNEGVIHATVWMNL